MTIANDALKHYPPQDFEIVRGQVRTGDIALCCGDEAFSKVIRWATASPWSHVALLVRVDEVDRVMAFESVEKIGVRAVPFDRFCTEDSARHKPYPGKILIARHKAFEGAINPDSLKKMVGFAVDRFGAPFDPAEITKIMTRVVLGRLGKRLPDRLQPKDEYICSEYVAECWKRVGITVPWDQRGFLAPASFAATPEVEAVCQVQTR